MITSTSEMIQNYLAKNVEQKPKSNEWRKGLHINPDIFSNGYICKQATNESGSDTADGKVKESDRDLFTEAGGFDWDDRNIILGSVASGLLLRYLAGQNLKKQLKKTPNIPEKKIPDILEHSGLPKDLPIKKFPGMQNAAYIPPHGAIFYKNERRDLSGRIIWPGLDEDEMKRVKKTGLIAYDPSFLKAGIMSHEAGHAEIGNRKWNDPSKINQNVRGISSAILGGLAVPAGAVAGKYISSKFIDKPALSALAGGLAGGGIGLAANAPVLFNEYQATKNAKKYLKDSGHRRDTKKENEKTLSKAFKTYALAAAAVPALVGGGFAAKYSDNYYT